MLFITQATHLIFGADITLKNLSEYSSGVLDEYKIRNVADNMLKENGGMIESYAIMSDHIKSQMKVPGKESTNDYILGTGLIAAKSNIDRLILQATE